jgi:general secretion pathway protein M
MKALNSLRAHTQARWQALGPREQRGLSVLGTLGGVVLFWSVAIGPALNTLRDSDNRRTQISQQQVQMLALQTQAQTLQTRTPLSRDEALRILQSLSAGTAIQLNVQGDRVSVQLKTVPAPILANWLTQARAQAQALPVETHLSRSNATAAGNATVAWDGSLVLSLPNRSPTR